MAEIGTDIEYAKKLLDKDELVAIPTETVYGLAGKGFSPEALLKIFKTKNRPSFDPLIAHTDSIEKVEQFVEYIPDMARDLASKFWPGALTLLLPKSNIIPDIMTSGLPNVAVRIPNHPLTLSLLKTLDYPIAAPSANPFGYVSPTKAQHVNDNLGDRITYILDGGSCLVGLESTIVGFENNETVIYRLGGLKVEAIEAICGKVKIRNNQSSDPKAPGMIKSHYSPGKPVELVPYGEIPDLSPEVRSKTGIISFKSTTDLPYHFVLSKTGDLQEAAFNLFTALRFFENTPVTKILAEKLPDTGLGMA
ncbi:MAG: L-threonylcarbamoyladenylate synthase, partial [Cyclobacteriaceae bacterium]